MTFYEVIKMKCTQGDYIIMQKMDCRGLACPSPVLKTKELVDAGTHDIAVLVDNEAAKENVSRFLVNQGFDITIEAGSEGFIVMGVKQGEYETCGIMSDTELGEKARKITVMVTTDRIGFGDDALGLKLMVNFLATLKETGKDLWRLIFVNNGVKLTIEGAETLPSIQELERSGVHVMVCGTCLNHFGLLEEKRVGETTNMLDVVTSLQVSDKVISL
jgi:selenium metabolism protein YedF